MPKRRDHSEGGWGREGRTSCRWRGEQGPELVGSCRPAKEFGICPEHCRKRTVWKGQDYSVSDWTLLHHQVTEHASLKWRSSRRNGRHGVYFREKVNMTY